MRDLSVLRDDWATIEVEETRLLRALTVQESACQSLILQHTFEPQLQQTTALFGPERQAALSRSCGHGGANSRRWHSCHQSRTLAVRSAGGILMAGGHLRHGAEALSSKRY